ncbi:ficolin-like protein 1 [Penaeus vannamei]|uniref:Ficolin-like protein 1 n=1 Tax=Penaeus vannamei TaxID=6689 RepID=A0A3R7Q7Y6_PENVA|nr:ficolin-like protein 1 [Penaeus vannamei]
MQSREIRCETSGGRRQPGRGSGRCPSEIDLSCLSVSPAVSVWLRPQTSPGSSLSQPSSRRSSLASLSTSTSPSLAGSQERNVPRADRRLTNQSKLKLVWSSKSSTMWAWLVVSVVVVVHAAATTETHNTSTINVPSELLIQLLDVSRALQKLVPTSAGASVDAVSGEEALARADDAGYNSLLSLALRHHALLQQKNEDLLIQQGRCTARIEALQEDKQELREQLEEVRLRRAGAGGEVPLQSGRSRGRGGGLRMLAARQRHGMRDCAGHQSEGSTESGIYEIFPLECKAVRVWCDLETDGGGWTVFLNRVEQPVQENFTRTWNDYRDGFGDVSAEYWLGNEVLHQLTMREPQVLRVDAEDFNGSRRWGIWSRFRVDDEAHNYKLLSVMYSSNSTMGDGLLWHSGMEFSTIDRDNDMHKGSCASEYRGGWWYNVCHNANPTGILVNSDDFYSVGWVYWSPRQYKTSESPTPRRRRSTAPANDASSSPTTCPAAAKRRSGRGTREEEALGGSPASGTPTWL